MGYSVSKEPTETHLMGFKPPLKTYCRLRLFLFAVLTTLACRVVILASLRNRIPDQPHQEHTERIYKLTFSGRYFLVVYSSVLLVELAGVEPASYLHLRECNTTILRLPKFGKFNYIRVFCARAHNCAAFNTL